MVVLKNIKTYEEYTDLFSLLEQVKLPDNLTVAAKDNVVVNNLGRGDTLTYYDPFEVKFKKLVYRPTTGGTATNPKLSGKGVDNELGIHGALTMASFMLAFCGPYGLVASSILQVVDALIYFFKENDIKMGILSLIFACLPAFSVGKLAFQGSKTIGVKGIMALVSKFEFKGGKFLLKSGMAKSLTSNEKLLILSFFKNKNIILKTIEGKATLLYKESSGVIKNILAMVAKIVSLFGFSMAYIFTWDMLVTPDMSPEQKENVKSITEDFQKTMQDVRERNKK
jgi:hypothetical protein